MYDIEHIKHEMAKQFMSARGLAKLAGVSAVTVKRIFTTHKGYPETIGKLVRALGLNPEDVTLPVEQGSGSAGAPAEASTQADGNTSSKSKEVA